MKIACKVYVAGPFTLGDQFVNVRSAILTATRLWNMGFVPYVPHLNGLWHILTPRPTTHWLELDEEWLRCCDCVYRIPGESHGADRECALAEKLGLPILRSLEDAQAWLQDRHKMESLATV